MGTIVKALKLLDFFSATRPEIGLTQFVRLSGYDKATTHRRLTELMEAGFLEQNPETRSYRLGVALLRLANVREQVFPAREAVMPALRKLAEATQETVHISLLQSEKGLATLAYLDDTKHATRVYIDEAELLPLHATASGIAVLAFSGADLQEKLLLTPLSALTPNTMTDPNELCRATRAARSSGFGISRGGYESEVYGIAAPIYNRHGNCHGAVAAATPVSRMTPALEDLIMRELRIAAHDITLAMGGVFPDNSAPGEAQQEAAA